MKNILKYLLLCCSALSLFGCEDYLDKTPQGDKTEEDVFTRFNETEQLINRLPRAIIFFFKNPVTPAMFSMSCSGCGKASAFIQIGRAHV